MPRRFDSAFTMFVHLKGHRVLEYYFDLTDARAAANDSRAVRDARILSLAKESAARAATRLGGAKIHDERVDLACLEGLDDGAHVRPQGL